ncbi:MAG: hypothetical protein MJK08_11295 [Campylobacterales bacterium]|nr:hypothetical protein [Campylobacterales bacterium]
MKKIVKLILLIALFLNIQSCADTKTQEKGKKVQENILLNKDIQYSLRIEGSNAEVEVFINGVRIYSDYSLGNVYINYPVNKYIRTGKNEIKIKLIAEEDVKYKIRDKAKIKVDLVVKNFKTTEEYIVSTLKYTHFEVDKTLGSSLEGRYSSLKSFTKNKEGNIQIDSPIIKDDPLKFGEKHGGIIVKQDVYFETTYPKWAFFDSDNILEKEMELYTVAELTKFKERPDIRELYDIYTKIHTALKNKNAESIIDMFDERNIETDIAWNDKSGSTKSDLLLRLKDASEDPDNEIVEFNYDEYSYQLEDNLKIIYIDAIAWNKKNGGSRSFSMKFRRENGKWILTR